MNNIMETKRSKYNANGQLRSSYLNTFVLTVLRAQTCNCFSIDLHFSFKVICGPHNSPSTMRLPYNYRLALVQPIIDKDEISWLPSCFTTLWPLKVGILHERKITLKKGIPKCKVLFLSHTSKLNQQKQ